MLGLLGGNKKNMPSVVAKLTQRPLDELTSQEIEKKENPGLDMAADEMIRAMHSKDAKAFRVALENFHELHEQVIHEAGETPEEEKSEHEY